MTSESQLVNDISSTYDELPYTSKPFSQTHPSYLRAICSLFDRQTPAIETTNILEIGCSFGGNILPIAMHYPKANILGLDLSAKQIAVGKTAIEAMGLKNIQLQHQDITTYQTPAKFFDYIICHGVFSWVPAAVQDAILRVVAEGLTDNGVAIVSYNTYPGWKISEVYRDAMRYRGQVVDDIRDKVSYGFGMLDFLKQHLPKQSPWGVAIEQHYEHIRHADLSYVAHEYLEMVNQPCYFHEFMSLAQEKGLSFVAEADFQNHFLAPVGLDNESYQALQREANGDVIKLEQLADFLSNRTFRQTILTRGKQHQQIEIGNKFVANDILTALHIQGTFFKEVEPQSQIPQWRCTQHPDGVAFKQTTLTDSIFSKLNAMHGQTIQVKQLWQQIQAEHPDVKQTEYLSMILELMTRRAVKICSQPVQWGVVDSDKPRVFSAIRKLFQWMQTHPNTIGLSTIQHEPFASNIITDELLPYCDGQHSREDLYEKLRLAVRAGRVIFYDDKQVQITEEQAIAEAIKEHTDSLINLLAYNGLLC